MTWGSNSQVHIWEWCWTHERAQQGWLCHLELCGVHCWTDRRCYTNMGIVANSAYLKPTLFQSWSHIVVRFRLKTAHYSYVVCFFGKRKCYRCVAISLHFGVWRVRRFSPNISLCLLTHYPFNYCVDNNVTSRLIQMQTINQYLQMLRVEETATWIKLMFTMGNKNNMARLVGAKGNTNLVSNLCW